MSSTAARTESNAIDALKEELLQAISNSNDISLLNKVRDLIMPISAEEEAACMTKEDILADFDQACKEVKLRKEGKLKFKTIEETLDEL